MSFRAQEWAYSLRELSGIEKAVLNCLAWHHNAKTGLCCPGNQLIADETGFSLSAVKKALASLIGKGLVSRYPWKRRSAYLLAITEPAQSPSQATTEPPIEQETNRKERKGSNWDWKERKPAPLSDARARAEKRAAEFREEIGDTVRDRGTEEDRAVVAERALAIFRGAISGGGEAW